MWVGVLTHSKSLKAVLALALTINKVTSLVTKTHYSWCWCLCTNTSPSTINSTNTDSLGAGLVWWCQCLTSLQTGGGGKVVRLVEPKVVTPASAKDWTGGFLGGNSAEHLRGQHGNREVKEI